MLILLSALLLPIQATPPEEASVVRWAHLLSSVDRPGLELRFATLVLDDAEAAVPGTAEVSYLRAVALARGGQRAKAIDALEEARRRGWVDAAVARWDEGLASLRAEAAFDAVVWAMEADARAL